jgi:hypothetical protein
MQTSEQINELAGALAKAQGELKNPAKTTVNGHFKNRYADLATGLETVRSTLSRFSLSIVQMTRADGDMVFLHTRLLHASGQWLESTYPVCRLGKHQEMGSALTYSRRYALFALVGIAGDDDDDGESAAPASGETVQRKTTVDRWAPTRKALEASVEQVKRETSNSLKKNEPDLWPTIERKARAAKSVDELTAVWHEYEELYERMPQTWKDCMWEEFARLTSELEPVPA